MKKIIFWAAVSITAFFVGLSAFVLVFLHSNPIPEIPAPDVAAEREVYENYDCYDTGFPGLAKKISEIKKGKSPYFPRQILGNDMSPKHSVAGWYSRHLSAMEEKSLLTVPGESAEIYRFLWLRTFHHPIFVRIERRRNDIRLFTKELGGAGGYEPGKILRSSDYFIREEDFRSFLDLLEKADYWNLPTDNREAGNDGAEWILEGVRNGRYHFVERWNPESGAYREACLYLLKLSGVDADRLHDDLY